MYICIVYVLYCIDKQYLYINNVMLYVYKYINLLINNVIICNIVYCLTNYYNTYLCIKYYLFLILFVTPRHALHTCVM